MLIATWLTQITGLSPSQIWGNPSTPLAKIRDDGKGNITITDWNVPDVPEPTDSQIADALAAPEPPPALADLTATLVARASAACAAVTAQVIPDQVHRDAYTNAATVVWASGGGAPSSDPAKTIFAEQAASVGISDPATFAKVVLAVSLGAMQLSTILGTLTGAAKLAKAPADLATALGAFETSLEGFIAALDDAGLTITISAPAAITIIGINA